MRIHVAPYLLLPHRPKVHPLIFLFAIALIFGCIVLTTRK